MSSARGNGKSAAARLALEEAVRSGQHTHWGGHSGEFEVTNLAGELVFSPVVNLPPFNAIVCNYLSGGSYVRKGAKAYVNAGFLGGNLPHRVKVEVLSRGGRWVEKWESTSRLGNWRLVKIPRQHPKYGERSKFAVSESDFAFLQRSLGER